MNRKNPTITENILNETQEYRNELLYMQLYHHEATRQLKNPRNSVIKTKNISTNIQELIEEMLYHFEDAKLQNKLPQEFKYSN